MEKYFREGRKKLLTLLLWIFMLCMAAFPVKAASGSLKLSGGICESETSVSFSAKLPKRSSGEFAIYRSTSKAALGKKSSLVGTIRLSGSPSWNKADKLYWIRLSSEKDTVLELYSSGKKLSGNVTIFESGLKVNKTYYYKIVDKKEDGTVRARSNAIKIKTVLNASRLVMCYAKTNSSVALSWTKNAKAAGYIVYRKLGKKWSLIKNITSGSVTSYTDTTAKSGNTYYYRIRVYCKSGGKTIYGKYGEIRKVTTKNPTVKGTYSPGSVYGPSLNSTKLAEVRRVVQGFKDAFITDKMSEYEKVYNAFGYLRTNCSYAWRGWQYNSANTAWGALVYGEAQCSGYARAMKALCDAMGVSCYYVHANSSAANPSHQWNFVKVDGKWYILDAQGGFFLVGSKLYQNFAGMRWNSSGFPAISETDHPKAGLYF